MCAACQALQVLEGMRSRGTRPDVVTFNTTISACASSKKWAEALQLLEEGKKLPSGPDQLTYGAVISACEDHWELALHLLNDMSASKLQLNEVTSASTIRACSNGDNPESAIELLRALQQKAVRQNVVTYTSAMAACHRDQFLWPWSLWLLSNMKDDAVEMDIGLFNAAMGVCRQAHGFGHLRKRNIGQVEQLFKDVQYHRLNPDVVTYSHVMAAVREAGEWERVLEVLDEALSSNLQADSQLYTNAIAACADAASWQSALHLLGIATAVGPSEHHWSAAMTACSDATQWQYALLLASGMTDIHLTPGVVSYTAMMSACTHGGMWQSTLRLLDMLQAAGEAPNYVTMTAVIKACMTNTNWTFALHWKSILDKLGVSGYFTTYTYLIWLCAEAEKWDWVEYLMAESTTRFPNAENFDQRQAGHVAELPDLNVPGFRLPPEASEDPSLMRSDAAASQSAPSVFAESVWQRRRLDEPGTLAGQGDSTGSANFQVADSEDWAGVLEPSNSFKGQAELDYDEKLKRHEASLTLAQRLGLVAKPAQPLTHEQWEQVKHASDSRQDSEVPCSICLEDFRTRPQVILSCSHVFHGECLRSFERFSGKRYCPLCRCPYFDATIHYSGLMVWRKKSASRIQRAWRGYRSRGEIFLQLRQPQLRAEAPTLSRPCARCESCALLWPLSTYAARAPFLEHIA
ncbi:RNF32 [Symbiodinium microadriaticum]|nr:RNF32 [Symbiodinium microadriaticum]